MGLSCKPVSKFKSIMVKMENELEAQKRATKEKKESKKTTIDSKRKLHRG